MRTLTEKHDETGFPPWVSRYRNGSLLLCPQQCDGCAVFILYFDTMFFVQLCVLCVLQMVLNGPNRRATNKSLLVNAHIIYIIITDLYVLTAISGLNISYIVIQLGHIYFVVKKGCLPDDVFQYNLYFY